MTYFQLYQRRAGTAPYHPAHTPVPRISGPCPTHNAGSGEASRAATTPAQAYATIPASIPVPMSGTTLPPPKMLSSSRDDAAPPPAPPLTMTRSLPPNTVLIGDLPVHRNTSQHPCTELIPRAALAELVMTDTTVDLLNTMAVAWERRRPVVIEGPTSAGKTAAVRYMAYKTGSPYRRINLSNATDVSDLVGRYIGTQNEPQWVDGPVVTALKRGEVVLLDEINLAPASVIERLNSLFDDDGNMVLDEHEKEVLRPHPDFRIFATGNPANYVGREQLSEAMRSRWYNVQAAGLTTRDVEQIVLQRFGNLIPTTELAKLTRVHQHLVDMAERRMIGRRNDGIVYTLRDLAKVAQRFIRYRRGVLPDNALMRRETEEIYLGGLIDPEDRAAVEKVLAVAMPYDGPRFATHLLWHEDAESFGLGDVRLRKLNTGDPRVPSAQARLVLTPRTKEILYRLMKALEMGENVALIGDRACGKTAMARMIAHLRGQPYYRQMFSAGTDTAQLVGGYDLEKWNDGQLLLAARPNNVPGIYLADEINLASPALLERLNPVLDDDRRLVLAEKQGETVRLHPEFRFIAAMNPVSRNNNGRARLSAAMHNRFTQIYVPDIQDVAEEQEILHTLAAPLKVAATDVDQLVRIHHDIIADYRSGALGAKARAHSRPVLSIRTLIEALRVMAQYAPQVGAGPAFVLAIKSQYAAPAGVEDGKRILAYAYSYVASNPQRCRA